jgi:hypothetical protein
LAIWAFPRSLPVLPRSTESGRTKPGWGSAENRPRAARCIRRSWLRQVLKTASRHGWLSALPDLSEPYGASGKISHRAWFSPEEYKQLYTATRECARNPKRSRYKWESKQQHDFVLFMANTGLRPDEAYRLPGR